MVNLELYKVFFIVAKCGSLTKAAEQLYISQPAVSQSIKQLETQLGTTLFNRTHRGVELSEHGGKQIYREVEEALRLLNSAENKLQALQSEPMGDIRIGATDSIFSHVLSDRIVAFHEKYPAVRIELVTGTSPETINQLKSGRVDVGFINLPVDDDDINMVNTVCHLNDVFVASNDFTYLKGRPVDLEELQSVPLLMIEQNTVARKTLAEFTSNLGVTLSPDVEVASWDFMLKLAVRGMGVGCLPREYCRKELDDGELFEVDVRPSLPARGIGLALPTNNDMSFALREFVNGFTETSGPNET